MKDKKRLKDGEGSVARKTKKIRIEEDESAARNSLKKKGKLPIADVRSILLGDKPPPMSEAKQKEKETALRRGSAKGEEEGKKSDQYAWESQSTMLRARSKKQVRVAPIAE